MVDYTTTDFRSAVSDVDPVIDAVGGGVGLSSLDVLKPDGLLLALPVPPDANRAANRGLHAEFVVHASDAQRLAKVASAIDEGVEVLIDRTVPLDDAADALDFIAAGHAKGMVIVVPPSH